MRTCQSCGGIIGRDCFNPMECEMITYRMEREEENRVRAAYDGVVDNHYNLQYLSHQFHTLLKHLERQGVDLSAYHEEIRNELPF